MPFAPVDLALRTKLAGSGEGQPRRSAFVDQAQAYLDAARAVDVPPDLDHRGCPTA